MIVPDARGEGERAGVARGSCKGAGEGVQCQPSGQSAGGDVPVVQGNPSRGGEGIGIRDGKEGRRQGIGGKCERQES